MPLFFLSFINTNVMQSLSQNVYDEVLQVWVGNTEHDDFNVGSELFFQMFGVETIENTLPIGGTK